MLPAVNAVALLTVNPFVAVVISRPVSALLIGTQGGALVVKEVEKAIVQEVADPPVPTVMVDASSRPAMEGLVPQPLEIVGALPTLSACTEVVEVPVT